MAEDGASTEYDGTENDAESTEYSPAMMVNDDLDVAEHESSETSTPVQKKGMNLVRQISSSGSTCLKHSAGLLSTADGFGPSPLSCATHASASRPRVCSSCGNCFVP